MLWGALPVSCLKRWLSRSSQTCPNCRKTIQWEPQPPPAPLPVPVPVPVPATIGYFGTCTFGGGVLVPATITIAGESVYDNDYTTTGGEGEESYGDDTTTTTGGGEEGYGDNDTTTSSLYSLCMLCKPQSVE